MSHHLTLWLYSLLPFVSVIPDQIITCLKQCGVPVRVTDDYKKESGPGILLVEEPTPSIYPQIRDSSSEGNRRILLICEKPVQSSGGEAWEALNHGAADLLMWQTDIGGEIKSRFEHWVQVDELVNSPAIVQKMVGESAIWKSTLRQIVEAAFYTQGPVLLTGETGTGKELAANFIHALDPKRNKYNLVVVDCTTIVPELSGSELFGHERGAFTGAISGRDGAFSLADRGVLFLDEVGELSPGLQVQLLRVLQEHTYKRVGSNVWHNTDFRLVCATNRDLLQEVEQGRFRRDLYYRLASWKIQLPSLQERKEDILPLVEHFLSEGDPNQLSYLLDPQVKHYFLNRSYPGNVRDLKNLTLRIKARSPGNGRITMGDIPLDDRPVLSGPPLNGILDQQVSTTSEDSTGGPTTKDPKSQPELSVQHERLAAYIHHSLSNGMAWDEIQQVMQEIAARAIIDMTQGDFKLAAKKIGRGERTIRDWLSDKNEGYKAKTIK
jgi:transcriptional regulator with GAF, ATPase, and Fis domain